MELRVAIAIIYSIQRSAFMEGLRERRSRSSSKPYSIPKVKSVVRQLDFFPKVDDDYVVQTKTGGYCSWSDFDSHGVGSVLTLYVLLILFLSEFWAFCTTNHTEVITVRNSTEDTLFINFNITLYNITCGSDLNGLRVIARSRV